MPCKTKEWGPVGATSSLCTKKKILVSVGGKIKFLMYIAIYNIKIASNLVSY